MHKTKNACISPLLASVMALWVMSATGEAEQISEFTISGATVRSSLVTGLNNPLGIAVSGNDLFVVNRGSNSIGEYDATTGATINPSLITGLRNPIGLAISGNDLFVTNVGDGTIGEYTTSGATVNVALIYEPTTHPEGIAAYGGNLYVANYAGDPIFNTISEFTTSGVTVNAALISDINSPWGVAVADGSVFVSSTASFSGGHNYPAGVGEFTTSGATVNPLLVTGLDTPIFLAVSDGLLFVSDQGAGTVGVYDASTGTLMAGLPGDGFKFISPEGIAVSNGNIFIVNGGIVPEPATVVTATLACIILAAAASRRKLWASGRWR